MSSKPEPVIVLTEELCDQRIAKAFMNIRDSTDEMDKMYKEADLAIWTEVKNMVSTGSIITIDSTDRFNHWGQKE